MVAIDASPVDPDFAEGDYSITSSDGVAFCIPRALLEETGAFAAPFCPATGLVLTHPTDSAAPLKLYLLLTRRLPTLPPPFPDDLAPVLLLLNLLERWEPGFPANVAAGRARGIPDLPSTSGPLFTINTYPLLVTAAIATIEERLTFAKVPLWPRAQTEWYRRLWADPGELRRHLPMVAGIITEREAQTRRWAEEIYRTRMGEGKRGVVLRGNRVVFGIGWGLPSAAGEEGDEEVGVRE